MFQSYDVELREPPSPEPDLPPWYQGFDKVGTKTSAKAQAITRVRRAMVSSGLVFREQTSANIGAEWEDPVAAGPSLGKTPAFSFGIFLSKINISKQIFLCPNSCKLKFTNTVILDWIVLK